MCTLVVAWQVFADAPVAIAANRDEAVDRPAHPPAVIETSPRVVAPRDERAGGTWIGYNEHGLAVAITNRWTEESQEGDRSRGLLVRDALEASSAEDATRHVQSELTARAYEPFNLLLADEEDAILLEWDGPLHVTAFDPGVHVVMNVGYDDTFAVPDRRRGAGERQVESARQVRRALQPAEEETVESWLDRAGAVLGDHDYGVCVHGDGYGTRSSSLLAIGETVRYRFADGPPCETAYRDVEGGI